VIAFCGVHFMGETAKILNPGKRVVIPDANAGCSLSDSCPPEQLAAFLQQHAEKNYYVIAYINCSAGVKALCDVICTSGNAVKIVNAAPKDRNILFVPDQNLGAWVMEQTGRPMELWRGNCYVHVEFTRNSIERARAQHPGAPIVAHPECTSACACSPMRSARREDDQLLQELAGRCIRDRHRIRHAPPAAARDAGENLHPRPTDACACADCRYMKMNTLEKLHDCLLNLQPEIIIPEETRARAEIPIRRMLELSR
jgi:quinolinate synthase